MNKFFIALVSGAIALGASARNDEGASVNGRETSRDGGQKEVVADTLDRVERLGEVVVRADDVVITPNKMMVSVSNKVRKHAYDGYSALALLNIPGVDVNVFDRSVTANSSSVVVCINGLEATEDELRTLNPKYIQRVDYYNNFDPRHPEAEYVLDFIIKVRDSGGEMMLQATQNLDRKDTDGMADWKTFRKGTELGVRLSGGYDRYNPSALGVSMRSMMFGTGEVTRMARGLSSLSHDSKIEGKVTWLHRTKRGVLKGVVSVSDGLERSDRRDMVEYFNSPLASDVSRTETHNGRLSPSFKISYDHKYASNVRLSVSLGGQYSHTDGWRNYYGDEDFLSVTKENYYQLRPNVKVTVPVGKKVSVYGQLMYFYDNSRQRYVENGRLVPSRLINGQGIAQAGANIKMTDKLNVSVRMQERVVTTDAGRGTGTDCYFTPSANVTYAFDRQNQLRGSVGMGVYDPQLAMYSTDMKRIDDYMVRMGNPDLKLMRPFAAGVMWSSVHKWGGLQLSGGYENTSRAIYVDYICDEAQRLYVQTFRNGGHFERTHLLGGVQVNIIPNTLSMLVNLVYEHSKVRNNELKSKGAVYANARLTFMYGAFSGQVKVASPYTSMDRMGEYSRTPTSLDISAGYTVGGWSFNLQCRGPLMKCCKRKWGDYGGVSERSWSYEPGKDYNMAGVKVTYRFEYGKKHKYENIDIDGDAGSAILSH